jgi:hypothetical protein
MNTGEERMRRKMKLGKETVNGIQYLTDNVRKVADVITNEEDIIQ